jgi:hypothetical protein
MSFLLFLLAVFATTSGYAFRVPFRALTLTRSSTVVGSSRQDRESGTKNFAHGGEEVVNEPEINKMREFLDLKFGNYSQAPQLKNPSTNIVQSTLFHLTTAKQWDMEQAEKIYNAAKCSPAIGSKKEVFSFVNPHSADIAVGMEAMKEELLQKHGEDCLPMAITFSPPWDAFSPSPDRFPKCDYAGYLLYCVLTRILSMYYGMELGRVNNVLLQSNDDPTSTDIIIPSLSNDQMSNFLQATICHLVVKSNRKGCFVLMIHDAHRIFDEFPIQNDIYELLFHTLLEKLSYCSILVSSSNNAPFGHFDDIVLTVYGEKAQEIIGDILSKWKEQK